MQIVDSDFKAPGACFICQRTRSARDGGSMVDTGVDNDPGIISDRVGRIYTCDECVHEMAELYAPEDVPEDPVPPVNPAEQVLDQIQDIIDKARPSAAQEA